MLRCTHTHTHAHVHLCICFRLLEQNQWNPLDHFTFPLRNLSVPLVGQSLSLPRSFCSPLSSLPLFLPPSLSPGFSSMWFKSVPCSSISRTCGKLDELSLAAAAAAEFTAWQTSTCGQSGLYNKDVDLRRRGEEINLKRGPVTDIQFRIKLNFNFLEAVID